MNTQKIEQRLEHLLNECQLLERQIRTLPDGKIYCERDNHYIKWFLRKNGIKRFLPRKQRNLAEQLVKKRYYEAQLTDYHHEIDFLSSALQTFPKFNEQTNMLLSDNSNYRALLQDALFMNHVEWATDFEPCTKNPEALIHNTYAGIKVRSKSEAFITNTLYSYKIPFRYECALSLGNFSVFPDFTIQHPITKKIYYWEHFGQMDDMEYMKKAIKKFERYCTFGIHPDDSLILTYETKNAPLDSEWVRQIIEHHFL